MEAALMLIHAVTDAATEAGECIQQGSLHVVKPALLLVGIDHADPGHKGLCCQWHLQ